MWGVAKHATLVSVRVLDCAGSGTVSRAIAGLDWVARNRRLPAVANISLGAPRHESLNEAVRTVIAGGVQLAIAAGNSDVDACTVSPASTTEGVTVGNAGTMHINDRQPSSNWGSCVDLFAPGASILSASHLDVTSGILRSGTSMAAPHVAGVMALWLEQNPQLTPAELASMVVANATQHVVGNAKSTNAHLLHSLREAVPVPNQAPTARFTATCQLLACTFTDASSDADGTLVSWAWSFGDGTGTTLRSPSHSYAAAGTYTVRLSVVDNGGASAVSTQNITVSVPTTPPSVISLSASPYRVKKVNTVALTWGGAAGAQVAVYRNGVHIRSVVNSGGYTDSTGQTGRAEYRYRVCETGTLACSSDVTVQFR